YAHQDLPFEQLVDALRPQRDRSRHPLFQVMVTYGKGTAGALKFADLETEGLGLPSVAAKFDLTVAFTESEETVSGDLTYSADLFDRVSVERMAGRLVALLGAVAEDAGRPLSGLSMMVAGERDLVVSGWNDTVAPVPVVGGVHELV